MAQLSKELKQAILDMPQAEKDKLLLRLVAKDAVLCEQLEFSLVDEQSSLQRRRDEEHDFIEQVLNAYHESPGWLMMALRSVNGRITYHVKVTKDKYGEVELTLAMLNGVFEHQLPYIREYNGRTDNLAQYLAKRTQVILPKLEKLHPDLHIEFDEAINRLLENLHRYAPARYAREMKLPKRWESPG
jgi:hypothetical protein